ncbi:MAG: hypothetical protein K2P67_01010 [Gallionellaceae bacterium]|jgi:hypothetical protein|nr:hypothetical protein [Gallionellaceae bacterium]
MIGSINTYSFAQTGGSAAAKQVDSAGGATETPRIQSDADARPVNTQTISTLAKQLADSAARAEKRDSTLSRSELADKAKIFHNECSAEADPAIQAKHDSEVPQSKDPELLARAKQATAFLIANRHGGGEANPFAGLSREQLANITYDDSGTYTFNERMAAYSEAMRQEYEWGVKVAAKAMDEYNSTGKLTNFFTSILEHYKGLPAIEQAQYPKGYASDLESKIKLDFNYRTHQAEGKGENPTSLIETLLALPEDKTVNPKHIPVASALKLDS